VYNQDDIEAVAKEFGFTAVAPEKLSLPEQVALFSQATHIIGPSGAGFGGMLFASPGTQVLCWQDSRLTHMTILPDLATLTGSDYWHVFYEPEGGGVFTGNYHLDPNTIRRNLHDFVSAGS
jgi:capsular polysaccharide biosynthesis protein